MLAGAVVVVDGVLGTADGEVASVVGDEERLLAQVSAEGCRPILAPLQLEPDDEELGTADWAVEAAVLLLFTEAANSNGESSSILDVPPST